ncbi:uncharacterized protein V1510DRAFT_422571 [Dipodascopsis tothii]|uniref:uncharacterized protein n=1 Tax=Dipodascopsis tothii TaxID=44089 RepID=UPI0034CF6CAC
MPARATANGLSAGAVSRGLRARATDRLRREACVCVRQTSVRTLRTAAKPPLRRHLGATLASNLTPDTTRPQLLPAAEATAHTGRSATSSPATAKKPKPVQFYRTINQLIIPLDPDVTVPESLVTSFHPFYVADDIGKLVAMLASPADIAQQLYRVRLDLDALDTSELGSGMPKPTTVGLTEAPMDRMRILVDASKMTEPTAVPFACDRAGRKELVRRLGAEFAGMAKTPEAVTEWLAGVAATDSQGRYLNELVRFLLANQLPSFGPTLAEAFPTILAAVRAAWTESAAFGGRDARLYALVCELLRKDVERKSRVFLSPTEIETYGSLLDALNETLTSVFKLEGLPESCVSPYLMAMVAAGRTQAAFDMVHFLRAEGLAPSFDAVASVFMGILRLVRLTPESRKVRGTAKERAERFRWPAFDAKTFMGYFRPYLTSQFLTPEIVRVLLTSRWAISTPEEVFSLLRSSRGAMRSYAIVRTNQKQFLQAVVHATTLPPLQPKGHTKYTRRLRKVRIDWISKTKKPGEFARLRAIAMVEMERMIASLESAMGQPLSLATRLEAGLLAAECGSSLVLDRVLLDRLRDGTLVPTPAERELLATGLRKIAREIEYVTGLRSRGRKVVDKEDEGRIMKKLERERFELADDIYYIETIIGGSSRHLIQHKLKEIDQLLQ